MPEPSLPAVPSADLAEVVYDGEVVDEAAATTAGAAAASPDGPGRPRTVPAIARHAGYVAAGAVVAWRRWRHRRTRHERMMRTAELSGDKDALQWWEEHRLASRREARERWRTATEVIVALVKVAPWVIGITALAPGALGILLAFDHHNLLWAYAPYLWAAHAAGTAVEVASVALTAAEWAALPAVVLGLWQLGRTGGSMAPSWTAVSADTDMDITIDERAITQALAVLGLKLIADYLKDGLPMPYIVPPRQEGRGTYTEVRLPKGVTADEIGRRRPKLASGLYRLSTEVWPSTGADASHLKLWVADKGALAEGAGPYPLAEGGFTDVFKGLPFGRTLRGDPSKFPFTGRNTMCGGIPEQGKSNAGRVAAAGATLDVTVELRIYVPDTNFDFEPFAPRCARYVMGAEDEHIERILGELEELKDELQRRGQLLIDHEEQEVTRELAHAGIGLHPMFVLLEEAHVAIQHHKHGKGISGLLCDIVKLDRKRAVHLFVSTQAPTKDSMPRDVTRNCSNGIAFAVGDHVANDALLGQGAYRAGHRATELIPGTDRGTALCKGFSGERSEMVQVHRLPVGKGEDLVSPLVARAMAEMARKGRELPGSGLLAIESRDLLADLAEVTRDDGGRVNVAELPPRLRQLAPRWGEYKSLTGVQLRQRLEVEGVRVYTTGGTLRVDPADVARAATDPTDATPAGQGPVEELGD